MEEIYVIKLRGLPPSSPLSPDSSPGETRDLLYDAILGLGILHLILGLVSFLLGSLGLAIEYDATHTGAGLWCGLIFFSTGLASVLASRNRYQKLRMKICFCLSVTSTAMAAIYLVVTCLGVAYFHQSQHRKPHEMARIGGNTIVTAFLELVISVLSMFVSARMLWPCFWLSVSCGGVSSTRQKVIVSANVLGGNDVGLNGALSAVRQISPNCVISFRPPDGGLPDSTLKVEEYVRNGCQWSSTDSMMDSSGSSLGDEVDRGDEYVDAENWRNVAVLHGQTQIIPYYPKDYSGATGC